MTYPPVIGARPTAASSPVVCSVRVGARAAMPAACVACTLAASVNTVVERAICTRPARSRGSAGRSSCAPRTACAAGRRVSDIRTAPMHHCLAACGACGPVVSVIVAARPTAAAASNNCEIHSD